MPELVTTREQQLDDMTPKANIGRGMAIAPDAAFDIPTPGPAPEPETFLHPVKAFNDLINAVRANTAMVELLLKQELKARVFVDSSIAVGLNVAYEINYHERKYVFAYSFSDLTLQLSNGGIVPLVANQWQNVSFPRGTRVTVVGGSDASPTVIVFRACDVLMATQSGGIYAPAISNLTSVNSSGATVNLLAANTNRRGMALFNDSTQTLFMAFAATAATNAYTVQILPGAFYEMPLPIYAGVISGIWSAANGAAKITEMS